MKFLAYLSIVPFLILPAYTLYKFYKAKYISFFLAFRLGFYAALLSCIFGILGSLMVHLGFCGIENFGSTGLCDPAGASGWAAFAYIIFAIPVGVTVFVTKLIQEFLRRRAATPSI